MPNLKKTFYYTNEDSLGFSAQVHWCGSPEPTVEIFKDFQELIMFFHRHNGGKDFELVEVTDENWHELHESGAFIND